MNDHVRESRHGNYGWVICFACALLLFCTGGLATTGFAVYQPYLINIGGLTNTQSSTMLMFRTMFTLLGMLTTRRLIARFEVRRVVTAACFVCGAAFLVYAFSSNVYLYFAGASLAGFALGCGGMIPVSILISRWFNEHRGLALGICMAATGLSSIVASPVITMLVQLFSLRTAFLAEAGFIMLAAVVVYSLLYSKPSCINARPVGRYQTNSAKTYAAHNASKGLYFLMTAGIMLFGIPSNTISSHISVLYQSVGFSSAQIAVLVSIVGGLLAFGKCIYGLISDKLGLFRASAFLYAMLLVGAGMCCLADRLRFPAACAASAFTGFGLAVLSVSISMYASSISTEAEYAHTVTRFQIVSTLGSMLFGPVPGMIADRTGSYIPAFVVLFCTALTAAALLLATFRKIRMEDMAYLRSHRSAEA